MSSCTRARWTKRRQHSSRAEILQRTSEDGRVALGDRESCSLESIVKVEVIHTEPREGPTLEHGIHDEDVAAVMKGNYIQP